MDKSWFQRCLGAPPDGWDQPPSSQTRGSMTPWDFWCSLWRADADGPPDSDSDVASREQAAARDVDGDSA